MLCQAATQSRTCCENCDSGEVYSPWQLALAMRHGCADGVVCTKVENHEINVVLSMTCS